MTIVCARHSHLMQTSSANRDLTVSSQDVLTTAAMQEYEENKSLKCGTPDPVKSGFNGDLVPVKWPDMRPPQMSSHVCKSVIPISDLAPSQVISVKQTVT